MPYPEPEFLVKELFAIGSICLMTGAGGSGKSHLAFQIADAALKRKPIFGYPCLREIRPIYFCYDRPIGGTHVTLNKMSLNFEGRMQIKSCVFDDPLCIPTVKEIGDSNLIMLDGLEIICERLIDMRAGTSLMRQCQTLLRDTNASMLGLMGHSKLKGDKTGYVLSREKSIGTTAFGRCSESMIVIDPDPADPDGPGRYVTINARNAPNQKEFYQFNSNSWLVPFNINVQLELPKRAESLLSRWPGKEIVLTETLWRINQLLAKPLSEATFFRAIDDLIEYHYIDRIREGEYQLKRSKPN